MGDGLGGGEGTKREKVQRSAMTQYLRIKRNIEASPSALAEKEKRV